MLLHSVIACYAFQDIFSRCPFVEKLIITMVSTTLEKKIKTYWAYCVFESAVQ